MNEELLAKKIKHKSLLMALLSVPFIIIGIFLIYLLYTGGLLSMHGYLQPYPVSSISQLDSIVNQPLSPDTVNVAVTATPDSLVDAGIQLTEDNVETADYMAVNVEGKYVLCLISKSKYDALAEGKEYTFSGILTKLDPEVTSMVIKDMSEQSISETDAKGLLYGYYIDTRANGIFVRTLLYLFVLLVWAFAIFLLVRGLRPLLNINNHPQVKKLAKYGPVEVVLQQIEQQFESAGQAGVNPLRGKSNIVYLLKNWLIIESPMNVTFQSSSDLLWAYKLKHTTRAYGVITTGSYYYVKLMCRDASVSVRGDDFSIDKLLGAISEAYPWAVVGYSDRLASTWNTDPGQFVAHAEQIKAESHAGAAAAPLAVNVSPDDEKEQDSFTM